MPRTVLDAPALLAVLYREPSSAMVGPYFAQAAASSVNFSELAANLATEGLTDERCSTSCQASAWKSENLTQS